MPADPSNADSIDMRDKVAVVTGAGIGIGFEIAKRMASRGAVVVVNDIDEAAAGLAAKTICDDGRQCIAVAGDSSDLAVIDRIITAACDGFGKLDIAVANAGISPFGDFLSYSPEAMRRLLTVNVEGTFFLAQRAAKQMIEQETGGRILMMSSVTGFQYHPDATAYGMTKAAIRMLVKNLGVELASKGVRVNGVAPGATLTERTQSDSDYEATWARITPTGRSATPSDIANAALFLLSDGAEHITGQTLVIDGGWTATSPRPY